MLGAVSRATEVNVEDVDNTILHLRRLETIHQSEMEYCQQKINDQAQSVSEKSSQIEDLKMLLAGQRVKIKQL